LKTIINLTNVFTAVPPFSKLEIQRIEIGEPIYLYVEIVRWYSTSCKGWFNRI